eukprot:942786-Amphidinium_carterae.1
MTEAGGVIMHLADSEAKQIEQIMNKAWKADMRRSEPTRRLIPLVQEKGVYNILVKEPNSRVADAGANEAENGGSRSDGSSGGRHGGLPSGGTSGSSSTNAAPGGDRSGGLLSGGSRQS